MVVTKKDPSILSLRSSVGKQPLSSRPSAPSCGFGQSTRDLSAKTYMGVEQDRAKCRQAGGNNSPGALYDMKGAFGKQPLSSNGTAAKFAFGTEERHSMASKANTPAPGSYKIPETVGRQVVSTKVSAPKTVFGSGTRDAVEKQFLTKEHEKSLYGHDSPGPCSYKSQDGLGRQVQSKKSSAPAFKAGSEPRFNYDFVKRAKELPGAGAYQAQGSVGKQVNSKSHTLPAYGFGSATRDAAGHVFISQEHEKSHYGTCQPGPTTSVHHDETQKEVTSTKPNPAAWKFGSSNRDALKAADTPGPGAYCA